MTIANDAHHLARQLIALYGVDDAGDYAAAKSEAMLAYGDMDQCRAWQRVQEFIDADRARGPFGDAGAFVPSNDNDPGFLPSFR